MLRKMPACYYFYMRVPVQYKTRIGKVLFYLGQIGALFLVVNAEVSSPWEYFFVWLVLFFIVYIISHILDWLFCYITHKNKSRERVNYQFNKHLKNNISHSQTNVSKIDALERLANLHDRGVITKEELEVEKKKILDE